MSIAAGCTNCNLCTLANQDEYVDNVFEGYSAPMPRWKAQMDRY
jgi:hypothetical protein